MANSNNRLGVFWVIPCATLCFGDEGLYKRDRAGIRSIDAKAPVVSFAQSSWSGKDSLPRPWSAQNFSIFLSLNIGVIASTRCLLKSESIAYRVYVDDKAYDGSTVFTLGQE